MVKHLQTHSSSVVELLDARRPITAAFKRLQTEGHISDQQNSEINVALIEEAVNNSRIINSYIPGNTSFERKSPLCVSTVPNQLKLSFAAQPTMLLQNREKTVLTNYSTFNSISQNSSFQIALCSDNEDTGNYFDDICDYSSERYDGYNFNSEQHKNVFFKYVIY